MKKLKLESAILLLLVMLSPAAFGEQSQPPLKDGTRMQARCVPFLEDGKANGFQCFQIMPGSLYDKMGVKDADVIKKIDGVPLTEPTQLFEKFSRISTGKARKISLLLQRDGKEITKTYDSKGRRGHATKAQQVKE